MSADTPNDLQMTRYNIPPSQPLTKTVTFEDNMFEEMDKHVANLRVAEQPKSVRTELLSHQKQALGWMVDRENTVIKGGIIADDMGIGKSIQVLSLCAQQLKEDSLPTLIICPTTILTHWSTEIRTHLDPSIQSHILYYGQNRNRKGRLLDSERINFVLTSYGTVASEFKQYEKYVKGLTRHIPWLFDRTWERIILDEAHSIKNLSALTSKACSCLTARYRWCLTGTPIQNSLEDLYSLICFLKIEEYSNRAIWKTLMTKVLRKDERGISEVYTLLKKILLRRRKNHIINGKPIISLPPSKIEVIYVEMEKEEMDFYEIIKEKMTSVFEKMMQKGDIHMRKNYVAILQLILHMRQCCDHPYIVLQSSRKQVEEHNIEEKLDFDQFEDLFLKCLNDNKGSNTLELLSDFNNSKLCQMCSNTSDDYIKLECEHGFCKLCIQEYLDVHKVCPVCDMKIGKLPPNNSSKPSNNFEIKDKTKYFYLDNDLDFDESVFDMFDDIAPSHKPIENQDGTDNVHTKTNIEYLEPKIEPKIEPKNDLIYSNQQSGVFITETIFNRRIFFKPKGKLRQSAKMKVLLNKLQEIENEDPTYKCVIFSQFTTFLDLVETFLYQYGYHYVRLDGQMSQAERNTSIQSFSEDPSTKIFLVSLRAGAFGINLTCANHLFMLDPWWNPAVEQQAFDRIHRLGQKRSVSVYRLLVNKTVEVGVDKIQQRKKELSQHVLSDTKGSHLAKLTLDDIKLLFNEDHNTN